MSDDKRYFWIKLNENFFEDDTIQWIEEQENGAVYLIFYLKLALNSLVNNGFLIRYVGEKLIPYDVKALSKLTRTDSDTVRIAMGIFLEVGIISKIESGEIYINQIDEMIGSETEAARRKRKQRAKKKMLIEQQDIVPKLSHGSPAILELEKEKEKDIELDKELEQEKETYQSSLSDVMLFYQNNFGIMSPIIQDDLIHWSNDLSPDLVVEAMKKAAFNQKSYSYAKGILSNWLKTNIKTLEQVKQSELQFELSKQQKQQQSKGYYGKAKKIEAIPESMRKSQTKLPLDTLSDEEMQANERELRQRMEKLLGEEAGED